MNISTPPFIVDNTEDDWKVRHYLREWCGFSRQIDIATGYFEIGSLLCLEEEWRKVDKIRILMGDEVSHRTKAAFDVQRGWGGEGLQVKVAGGDAGEWWFRQWISKARQKT